MLAEYLRLAFRTLGAYRLRSFLTVLSITIGVGAIILLTSLAQSGLATLARGIEEIGGTRFVMLWQDSARKAAQKQGDYTKGLTYADGLALKREIPFIEKLSAVVQHDNLVTARRPGMREKRTDLVGTDDQFLSSWALTLAKGRNLTRHDLATRARVCLVGDELAQKLFPGEEAVGQELVLQGQRYAVVGRLAFAAKSGMSFGFSWNDLAVTPLTVDRPTGQVSMLAMTRREDAKTDDLLDRANAVILHRHNQVDDFQFFDMGGALKGFYAVFYGMILIVGLISGMSLVIGGVGIMNIMLVAVAERKREIGLRKAMGAPKATIMSQFLVEATVLSLFGAMIGMVIGVTLSLASAHLIVLFNKSWVGIVSEPAVIVAVLASAAVGLFFGWYPARQAAELDPILCLRSE